MRAKRSAGQRREGIAALGVLDLDDPDVRIEVDLPRKPRLGLLLWNPTLAGGAAPVEVAVERLSPGEDRRRAVEPADLDQQRARVGIAAPPEPDCTLVSSSST